MNRCVLLAAGLLGPLLLLRPASRAAELPVYTVTVPSTIRVTMTPDGSWTTEERSTRFETYSTIPDNLGGGVAFPPRLATITTVTSGGADDRSSSIAVAVDDMSGPTLRRVAAFTDPGRVGAVAGGLFFVSTEPGCCVLPARHHVRALETGRLLFSSTGSGEVGTAAWMQVPNARPIVERWVAFEGSVGTPGYDADPATLGELLYGDRRGVLSRTILRRKPGGPAPTPADGGDDLALDVASCGFLRWTEPGRPPQSGQPTRPAPGQCDPNGGYFAVALFSLEHRRPDVALAGIAVELSISGEVYATIPVAGDRLDPGHATLDDRLVLVDAPTPP